MIRPKKLNNHNSQQEIIPLSECLAKTIENENGEKEPGINVKTHCYIVGLVAQELISRLPKWLRKSLFPAGSELLAAAHDIGKVSPTFQEKIHRAIEGYYDNSLPGLNSTNPEIEKQWSGHAGVSQAAVIGAGKYIPEILGRHHGKSSNHFYLATDEVFGGEGWQLRREELLTVLKKKLTSDWPVVKDEIHASVLSGLTTVADWIGSGSRFDLLKDKPSESWKEIVILAVDEAGFLPPQIRSDLSFVDIFGFETRPAQKQLIDALTDTGAYVMEAPMGLGKTEAALYAAYKTMAQQHSTGLYFALPTQLTSNKIHSRVNDFLLKILKQEDPNRRALLLHGSAWLHNTHTEMGEEGQPGKSWFSSNKRGLLAPFAVGTVDQALMAVMNVKHGFVRTFGLAGKIVILDEVHTYDSYTGTLLDNLVKALREIHCTVIILSATLTQERRDSLLGIQIKTCRDSKAYPLISAVKNKDEVHEWEVEKIPDITVSLAHIADDERALNEALERAGSGQQVLWIENTVAEAQNVYRMLSARAQNYQCETGLIHSRFIAIDRDKKENNWINILGKGKQAKRQERGRILVGTQVLEQSLDIDADFLITRLAPTDMLLQRMGRLWRHRENDSIRPKNTHQEAWILTQPLNAVIQDYKKHLGKSRFVYMPFILLKTLEVWQSLDKVLLPGQIRDLLEKTYKERREQSLLQELKEEVKKQREKLERFALIGLATGGNTLPESKASTRYSEVESCEILLVRSVSAENKGTAVRFLDNTQIFLPKNIRYTDKSEWKKLSARLMQNTLKIPEKQAPAQTNRKALNWLEGFVYLGGEDESPFRVGVVHDSCEIFGTTGNTELDGYSLSYNESFGYEIKKTGSHTENKEGW